MRFPSMSFALVGAGLLGIVIPGVADAATNLDTVVNTYKNSFAGIQTTLLHEAISLFWLLAAIEFTWAVSKLALTGADFGDWLATIVQQVMFIGLFYAVLTNSVTWGSYIVDSFRQAGNAAATAAGGQSALSPTDIFNTGVNIATAILDKLDLFKPAQSIAFALSGIIILICFALIAAMMILTLVVAYGIVSMGILFMGFGGSRWTKEVATKIVMAVMGVGAKLFVMEIVVGVGASMVHQWESSPTVTVGDCCVMVGCAVVMLALVKTIPDLVQSMISGATFTSGGALTAAASAVAGAAGGVAANVVGAGAAVAGASNLASAQLETSASGTRSSSRMARMAAFTGNTAQNLGSSAVQDIGNRLSGRAHHGNMGGRMASNMYSEAGEMRANSSRPASPTTPSSSPDSDSQKSTNTIHPE